MSLSTHAQWTEILSRQQVRWMLHELELLLPVRTLGSVLSRQAE